MPCCTIGAIKRKVGHNEFEGIIIIIKDAVSIWFAHVYQCASIEELSEKKKELMEIVVKIAAQLHVVTHVLCIKLPFKSELNQDNFSAVDIAILSNILFYMQAIALFHSNFKNLNISDILNLIIL